MTPHCLSLTNFTKDEILNILTLAQKMKAELKTTGHNQPVLHSKTLAMIFEKPSLRTRVSFEVGMTQLGGHALYLGPSEIGLGQREAVSDVSKVLSSMADIVMARVFDHQVLVELSIHSQVPVINALSDLEHPCQTLADLLTIQEVKGSLTDLKIAFVGDGDNNVVHSLALAAAILGLNLAVAAPPGYSLKPEIVAACQKINLQTGGVLEETLDPVTAVTKADVVYTDTWISMGDEAEKADRLKVFMPYQVTTKLMVHAKSNAIFMHDMPAYRGNEVTAEVIDGPVSVIFQQAENRLHAQKALLVSLLGITYEK